MRLEGFQDEQTLNELLYEGKISQLEYIRHHSQEMTDEFKEFCKQNGLEENEESADRFRDNLLRKEEEAHTDGLD